MREGDRPPGENPQQKDLSATASAAIVGAAFLITVAIGLYWILH